MTLGKVNGAKIDRFSGEGGGRGGSDLKLAKTSMDLSTPFGIDCHSQRSIPLNSASCHCVVLSFPLDVGCTPSNDLLIARFAVVSQHTVHFVSQPALRSDPTHSAFVARHLVGVCQTAVPREHSRSSGQEFVQCCVLLTFSCCQSQSMFLTFRQSQSMFFDYLSTSIDVRDRSCRAAHSSFPGDVEQMLRTSTHDAASCSSHTFMHFLLS